MEFIRVKCPQCGKRAFDISKFPSEPDIVEELKCPNCHTFVRVPLNPEKVKIQKPY